MGREYVVQTWVKHSDDDHRVIPDSEIINKGYSGEQIGNRQLKSTGHLRSRTAGYLANGNADIAYYPDQDEIFKDNPLFLIDPAFKQLALYQDQVVNLDKALKEKRITKDRHDYALRVLDAKIFKAEQKLDKLAYSTIPDDVNEDSACQTTDANATAQVDEYTPTTEEKAIAIYIYENSLVEGAK